MGGAVVAVMRSRVRRWDVGLVDGVGVVSFGDLERNSTCALRRD
jgi:hypothetical protein